MEHRQAMTRMPPRSGRVAAFALVAVLFILAGCGPVGGDESATETPAPTRDATEAATPAVDAAPAPDAASPGAAPTNGPATPSGVAAERAPAATPGPVVGRSRPVYDAGSTSAPIGDGTSGATPVPDSSAQGDAGTEAGFPTDPLTVDSCEPSDVPDFSGAEVTFVVATNLNFRAGPGSDCDPLGDALLETGTQLTATSDPVIREGEGTEWIRVDVDGQQGWVATEFIDPE